MSRIPSGQKAHLLYSILFIIQYSLPSRPFSNRDEKRNGALVSPYLYLERPADRRFFHNFHEVAVILNLLPADRNNNVPDLNTALDARPAFNHLADKGALAVPEPSSLAYSSVRGTICTPR